MVIDLDYLALPVILYFLIGFFIFPLFLGPNYQEPDYWNKAHPIPIIRIIIACLVIFPTTSLLFNYNLVFPNTEFMEQISLQTNIIGTSTELPPSPFNNFFSLPPSDSRFFGLSLWAQQSAYSTALQVIVMWIFLNFIIPKLKDRT